MEGSDGWMDGLPSTDDYAGCLEATDPLREDLIRRAVKLLALPRPSSGVDAGCGIGTQAMILSDGVGAQGRVTGIDVSHELLGLARERVSGTRWAKRITFQEGDIRQLPLENDAYDWVWSSDCVGYAPGDQISALKELVRIVRPGGVVAILAWSSQRLLPGFPWLEERLNATAAGIAPFTRDAPPARHFHRAMGWMRELGLQDVRAHTLVADVQAPLSGEERRGLAVMLRMRWERAKSEISGNEWGAYERLTRPGSEDFILNLPDYYGFFTYSLFRGTLSA